ncbi:TRAP transporter permease [Gelria sp. Kuro-4]|uniref:TRAP transporter permease n=1 Tax=Gelria sp. Kuro-4 TaxID=2796927 RepID=UPI001BF035C6|nr:TRAP transporter permease [Gelria sp. Kuro-4]BCV25263.1 C4-dicarboxylate ABC transporter [Gelria sp. Kuro-4]
MVNPEPVTQAVSEEPDKRVLASFWRPLLRFIAIAMSVYHLSTAVFGIPEALIYKPIHLTFALVLGFIIYPATKKAAKKVPFYDIVFALVAVASLFYILSNYERISWRLLYTDPLLPAEYFFGAVMLVLVLELTRRTMGWPLVIVALAFTLHTIFGQYFPGILRHTGVPFRMFVEHMYLTTEGLWGMPVGVSATYVFLFILFGCFLEVTGVGNFFIKLATTLTSRSRGGPAKAAVLASGLFGSISGSAVANVYGTGIFTIPLMKKIGFPPNFAGAVEAVASSGGAIMPPVMGSAAFLMADFLGIPYIQIAKASLVPALLYYICLWFIIDKKATVLGIGCGDVNGSNASQILRDAYLLLPLVTIMVLLIKGFTPFYAAFWTICSTILIGLFKKETRLTVKGLFDALADGGQKAVSIASAMACASIVVGAINLTGLGLKITSVVLQVAGGNVLVVLFLIMVITLVLGMGLPTPAAYLIAAIFGPSALTSLGVAPLAAHLFIFYYAALSTITPPVAMAAYAGADIAKADANRTGFTAMRLGLAAYIIPWFFVFSPALMLQGSTLTIVEAIISGLLGIYALASGVEGIMVACLGWVERTALIAAALALIKPGLLTDLFGLAVFAVIYFIQQARKAKGVVAES